jgi:hypothetical protein
MASIRKRGQGSSWSVAPAEEEKDEFRKGGVRLCNGFNYLGYEVLIGFVNRKINFVVPENWGIS